VQREAANACLGWKGLRRLKNYHCSRDYLAAAAAAEKKQHRAWVVEASRGKIADKRRQDSDRASIRLGFNDLERSAYKNTSYYSNQDACRHYSQASYHRVQRIILFNHKRFDHNPWLLHEE
jgi:hypothetical protein